MLSFRWWRLSLPLALAGALLVAPSVLAAQQKHGDVNGDGVVSALDAQAILTAVVGLPLPAGFVIANGDADCNTTSVALDAQIVLSHVIGLNVSQYCVGQAFGPAAIRVRILPGNDAAPHDSALLVNRTLRLRAALTDTGGFNVQRPIVWATSNSDIVSIDSTRGDTAWVKARTTAGTATLTAFSDGAQSSMAIQSVMSHAGVVITPQRSDTLRQLNAPFSFILRTRDSLGNISGNPTGTWTTSNTAIATTTAGPSGSTTLTTATNGTVWLHVTSTISPTLKDSVRLVVRLPALNSCTGTGGTLHPTTTYTTPQTWLASENPHYVTGTQSFNAGSGLTVGPGTLVCFSSGPLLSFAAGTRLVARGTPDSLITFTGATPSTTWNGILLGNAFSYTGTAPSDTSWITNALIERGGSSQGIVSRNQHALIMDSVRIRQSTNNAVQLFGPGSRLSRSVVDTMTGTFGTAVTLGQGLLELTTVRTVANITSVSVSDTGAVRDVQIIGGAAGIQATSAAAERMRLNNVTISGVTSFALDLQNASVHPASSNVQILSGTGGAFRGHIGTLGVLFADSLQQEMLKGKGKDTLFITGGSLTNATVVVRPDLPWYVNQITNIDTLAVLAPRPGSRMVFQNAGFRFQSGGRLVATGEPTKFIRFLPIAGNNFYGLLFQNPGPGPDPQLAPTAISTMSYAQVDSSSGSLGTPEGGLCCAAALTAGSRHRLIADSIIVRKSLEGAVFMAAPGSELKRSLVDTTGQVTSSYVANYPAVAVGRKGLVQNVLIRRSGDVGLYSSAGTNDTIVRLVNVRIVASREVGLQIDNGIVAGDLGSVRIDSANAYPFLGRIQHLAAIARDSVSQLNLRGNLDDVAVIVGGVVQGVPGTHTPAAPLVLEVIPGLRWQVTQSPNIDTLARLHVRPGSHLTFTDGVLHFTRGGTLNAVGTTTNFIHFRPLTSAHNWSGLRFDDPGQGGGGAGTWPYAVSTMTYVRVDSASGTGVVNTTMCCYSAAVNGGMRHRLLLDSLIVRKSHNTAIAMAASGSYLKRSLIDTTGNVSTNYTTTQPALVVGDTTLVENTLVRRSGYTGLYAPRHRALFTNVRVVAAQNVALQADQFALDPASTGVRLDSANAYPFYGRIENFGVIANTAALQTSNLLGNVENLAYIVGGTLSNRTVDVIPQLQWRVSGSPNIDTLAVLQPLPGADITFTDGILHFTRGGTLNAVGTTTSFIRFRPLTSANNWSGLRFDDPGQGGGGAGTWPYAVSTMTYVRVDSASGTGVVNNPICCYSAAISGGQRHRLLIDSVIVRKAHNAAIQISASGSYVKRTLIDTTGNVGTNYATTHPALIAGDTTLVENTLVRRSGHGGLYAPRHHTLLTNVRIVASRDVGIWADGFTLNPATTNVRADSANTYPFYGRIQNFGIIANTAALQDARLLGNTDNVAYIIGGTLTNQTVQVSAQLRWRVHQSPNVDTLAVLQPQPGADITFGDGDLQFSRGGTLNAVGTAGNFIRFRPASGASSWSGLRFDDPGSGAGAPTSYPIAISVMTYVRVDSASGTGSVGTKICCYSAAINGGSRHRLLLDSIIVHKAYNAAISLSASGSYLRRSTIDTTGNVGSAYQTNQAAVSIADSIEVSRTVIRRSGHDGFNLHGFNLTLDSVRVVNSRFDGFVLHRASTTYSGGNGVLAIVADSSGGNGFSIRNSGITLQRCVATRGRTATSHGAATTSTYTGVVIQNCDFLNNGGNGVNNAEPVNVTYVILADDNYWGDPGGPDTGDGRSGNVTVNNFCTGGTCTDPSFGPMQTQPNAPALPPRAYSARGLLRSKRRDARRSRRA